MTVVFLMHPVGVGATRAMNVMSAKLWVRALVDLLPDVAISAPWLPYAEAMVDRERGIRDALACAAGCHAAVAVGGEVSIGMRAEVDLFRRLRRPLIDLTHPPMPGLLAYETFAETRTPEFRQHVLAAFDQLTPKVLAA